MANIAIIWACVVSAIVLMGVPGVGTGVDGGVAVVLDQVVVVGRWVLSLGVINNKITCDHKHSQMVHAWPQGI